MTTINTSARCAAGKALAPEKEAARVEGGPGCKVQSTKQLSNFTTLERIPASLLRGADLGLWAAFDALLGDWLAEVL